ncbi:hypothetical protein Bca101_102038 [Brassica carinata]
MIGRADIEGSKSSVAMSGLAATSQLSLWTPALSFNRCAPQPNSPPDNVLRRIDRERVLGLKKGLLPRLRFTEGCSPWRPDAVMSTTGRERHSVLRIFKGRRECTGHHATCGALPAAGPYLRLSRFQGGQAICTGGAPPGSRPRFCSDRAPSYSSRPGSCPAAGIGRASAPSISGLVDSAGSANQLPYALRVYSPVDSHTCQTPWSVFQGGSNGSPQAGARARRCEARRGACCRPRLRQRRLRGRSESRA